MSRTIAILTDEEVRGADAPLVVHVDSTVRKLGSDSGLFQEESCYVLGRVGQQAVLFTEQEARELMAFLTKALKG